MSMLLKKVLTLLDLTSLSRQAPQCSPRRMPHLNWHFVSLDKFEWVSFAKIIGSGIHFPGPSFFSLSLPTVSYLLISSLQFLSDNCEKKDYFVLARKMGNIHNDPTSSRKRVSLRSTQIKRLPLWGSVPGKQSHSLTSSF